MNSQTLGTRPAGLRSDPVDREIARLLDKSPTPTPGPVDHLASVLPVRDQVARVRACFADGRVELQLAEGCVRDAIAAVSCLVRPRIGDLVRALVAGDSAWVTVILERDPCAAVELDFGEASVMVSAGAIALESRTDLELSANKLTTRAEVSLNACGDRYSNVTGTDSTQANCTLVRTAGHMSLHAGNTSITAESLIKVDAGQVHMC